MKVEVNKAEHEKDIEFPCLMEYAPSNLILLMNEDQRGTVIHKGRSSWRNGDYWESFGRNVKLKPFKGTITLSND